MDRALKYWQVNLEAHLEAMHALTSDNLNKGPPHYPNTNTNATKRYKNTTQPGTLLTTLLLLVFNYVKFHLTV